jgi:hypothetical protein
MNDQAPISTEHQVARHVLAELLRVYDSHPSEAVAVADAFLEQVAPEWPSAAPLFADIGTEAEWWADCAPDTAVSAMLVACLKRLALGRMIMAPNARKRALVAIWNTLDERDRAAFLTYAEPGSAGKA